MSKTPLIALQQQPAQSRLWAVKTYLDLISRDDPLVYGSGLRRLYAMSSGLATFNEDDIIAVTKKAERMGILPFSLHGFMVKSILKNCYLFGEILKEMIQERILNIANGDVSNPDPQVKYSPIKARREYYIPSFNLIKRVQKALFDDVGFDTDRSNHPTTVYLNDVASEAEYALVQTQQNEGNVYPNQTPFGSIVAVVDRLVYILQLESNHPIEDRCYRRRARAALKILWVITKFLYGDLTVRPERKDLFIIDLGETLNISDGTLAAIPFPTKQTLGLFVDDEGNGVTTKGRQYLTAISAAAIDRRNHISEG